jgi:hypothetical protein
MITSQGESFIIFFSKGVILLWLLDFMCHGR